MSRIVCPKCGNPACGIQSDAHGFWVWCHAPRCNINGPRRRTIEEAIDAFIDEVKPPFRDFSKCPICGEKSRIGVRWDKGRSVLVFRHDKPNESCPEDREIWFTSEAEARNWVRKNEQKKAC